MPNGEKPGQAAGERARERFRRLERQRERAIRDLENADWDETSEVVADVAARAAGDAAARTAKQLSRPDIEEEPESAPATKPPRSVFVKDDGAPRWVRIVVASIAALVGAGMLVVEFLRQAGVLK